MLAELDDLMGTTSGQTEELKLLSDVARGVYQLESFDGEDVAAATAIVERYSDLRLGLADASIVVLAARFGCHDILSLDERHFRAVHGPDGKAFRLRPRDTD